MAAPGLAVMLALAQRMIGRAHRDFLPPSHEMVVKAQALNAAGAKRFERRPAEIASCQFVDAYVRAYAAWHVYTGEE